MNTTFKLWNQIPKCHPASVSASARMSPTWVLHIQPGSQKVRQQVVLQMPRIWIEYCTLLVDQRFVTRARRAFDRAICALPITQHDRIWQLYLVRPKL